MLRASLVRYAAEFKQKSRWSAVWPNMRYGAMYLNYSVGRQLPMRGVNWVTRDSNRLVNFNERYGTVIADLDVKRNEDDLNIQLNDVRWNDHRRLYWRCSFCNTAYRKGVSMRVKFHAGCPACKRRHASEVLQGQLSSASLQQHSSALADQLADNGKRANIASLSCTSKFDATWTCQACGEPYKTSIRARTGCVEEGQAGLHPQIAQWTAYCPSCAWGKNLTKLGQRVMREGYYLGLEVSENKSSEVGGDVSATTAPKPVRRRRLTV